MHRILMCRPKFFNVSYKINPWMMPDDPKRAVDVDLATQQWDFLHDNIIRAGSYVEFVTPIPGLPDLCFTANAGLVHNDKVIVSKFRHPERQDESYFFEREFRRLGFQTVMAEHEFEGAGDAFILQDTLFLGNGPRSELKIIPQILDFLGLNKVVVCDLVDPSFYHLDTCFCPLSEDRVMWFPGAFSAKTRQAISSICEIMTHEIGEADAHRFACNSVVIPRKGESNMILVPAGCRETNLMLMGDDGGVGPGMPDGKEFEVVEIPMGEFMKAGGAAKCLTLRLNSP